MSISEKAVFTTMCMVYDKTGRVLVQDKVDKNWTGLAFPGGHVEKGENFIESAVREIKEETGLSITDLKLCGIKHFITDADERYIVILYKTAAFSGNLVSSEEGKMSWVDLNDINKEKCAPSFYEMLPLFLDDNKSEGFFDYKGNLLVI